MIGHGGRIYKTTALAVLSTAIMISRIGRIIVGRKKVRINLEKLPASIGSLGSPFWSGYWLPFQYAKMREEEKAEQKKKDRNDQNNPQQS